MFILIALVILLAPVLVVLYFEIKYYKQKKLINRLPGPPTLPVIGNAHQIGRTPSEILDKLFLLWNKYGQTNYRFWVGYYYNIIVSEVKDIEYILSSNTLIQKSDAYEMLHPWLGTGLLTSHGTKWHKHRKMITPSFHFKILQNFHDTMNVNSMKFIDKLREASVGETIFDFQDLVHYLTLEVICDTAMGVHINAMENTDSELVNAFKDICYNINMRAYNPFKRKQALYRFAPDYPKYCRTLKILQDFTNDVIEKRMQTLKNNEASASSTETADDGYSLKKQAFLDTLLTSTIDNRALTKEEIYEEVSTFVFEGHDTTTSGIAFAIYLLSRHPTIQQKVYAEQQALIGANLKRDATYQEIADMKYLDLVLKESLRLYPSVPIIARLTDKDYDINGVQVPKGTTLNLFLMALGYNEKNFPDPYRCDPERFHLDQRTAKQSPFEYVPFSAGPRNCIGQKFALLELKTVVSKIVRNFEILPPRDELISKDGYVQHFVGLTKGQQMKRHPNPSKYDPILSAVLTLKSDNGIQIRMRERK